MIYQNKGVSQVYYGDQRIREIWLGNKRIFGSPFVILFEEFIANDCIWLLAGGILYVKDAGKDSWHISARGVSDIVPYERWSSTSYIGALKDGNLHFSNNYGDLGDAVDGRWSRLWERLDASRYSVWAGCDCFGMLKAHCKDKPTLLELVFPEVRFKKRGITANDEWVDLEASLDDANTKVTVSLRPRRRDVVDFYERTYLNKQGEVRIYEDGAGYEENLSRERIVTTLSGTDIKFLSDTEFLHDGFIYTIGTDAFSKSDVGGFTDIGYINSDGKVIPCGIRDGVICKLDGSVVEGSPENVTDLTYLWALTSDYKVYYLSSGSAVLYLDLKELTDA